MFSLRCVLTSACVCISFALGDAFAPDHYSVLGLDRTCAQREITVAFRKLSLKFHPDKNPDSRNEAEAKFARLSEAYTVLSDVEQRRLYDSTHLSHHPPSQQGGVYYYNGAAHYYTFDTAGQQPGYDSAQGGSSFSAVGGTGQARGSTYGTDQSRYTGTSDSYGGSTADKESIRGTSGYGSYIRSCIQWLLRSWKAHDSADESSENSTDYTGARRPLHEDRSFYQHLKQDKVSHEPDTVYMHLR